MKAYKIKHIPSGLYFCPSRKIRLPNGVHKGKYVKSNLSKKGKIYIAMPSLKWVETIYSHLIDFDVMSDWEIYRNKNLIKTEEKDWLIEEM